MSLSRPGTTKPQTAGNRRAKTAICNRRNLAAKLVDREYALLSTFYREFTNNQERRRQNEIEHLKRQIMSKFRAELKVHIEESTRKGFSRVR